MDTKAVSLPDVLDKLRATPATSEQSIPLDYHPQRLGHHAKGIRADAPHHGRKPSKGSSRDRARGAKQRARRPARRHSSRNTAAKSSPPRPSGSLARTGTMFTPPEY